MAKGLPAAEPEQEDADDPGSEWYIHSRTRNYERDLEKNLAQKLATLVQVTSTSTDPAVRSAQGEYAAAKLALLLLRKHGRGKDYAFSQDVKAP